MDLSQLTTLEILERISRHCPSSLHAYLYCLIKADSSGKAFFSRQYVELQLSEGWAKFRNQIKKLAVEGILEWHPFNDGIAIVMADIDENA